jgi:hypothetical protein
LQYPPKFTQIGIFWFKNLQSGNPGFFPISHSPPRSTDGALANAAFPLVGLIEILVLERVSLVQQIFLAKNLVKSLLISTLDKDHFYRAQQNLSVQQRVGWRPAEK